MASLYLVTGGAGFIGSHIATGLVARGDRVRVLDDLSTGRRENLAHLEVGDLGSDAPVELVVGDIGDQAAACRACRGAEGVFHEAAQVSVPGSIEDPLSSYRINVMGTLNVLEAARAEGVKRMVFAASSAVYGDSEASPKTEDLAPEPLSPYASGKLAGEALLAVWGRAFGMKTVSLRYFNVFGPRQADDSPYSGVIAIFARRLLREEPVTIYGDGEQTRDFVYVEDVVQANLRAMEEPSEPGEVFNVGTGLSVSLNELYSHMRELTGTEAEAAHASPRVGDIRHSLASIERIRGRLGFEPSVSWKQGIAATLDWYRGETAG
jgi:nucleoside-diphosphate-sugar epimerase